MSGISEHIEELKEVADRREYTLQVVISVLARVPELITDTQHEISYEEAGEADYARLTELREHLWKLQEIYRIARLYTIEDSLAGVAVQDVLRILQEGLA